MPSLVHSLLRLFCILGNCCAVLGRKISSLVRKETRNDDDKNEEKGMEKKGGEKNNEITKKKDKKEK